MLTATHGQMEILLYLSTPVLVLTYISPVSESVRAILNIFTLLATNSQCIHAFAHQNKADVPYVVSLLQRYAILLSPEHHQRHHRAGYLYYSIVNGWSNPLLNLLYVSILQPTMSCFPSYFIRQYDDETFVVKLYGRYYDLTNFNHPGGKDCLKYLNTIPDATPYIESYHKQGRGHMMKKLQAYQVAEHYDELYDYTAHVQLRRLVYNHISANAINTKYRTVDFVVLFLQFCLGVYFVCFTSRYVLHFFAGVINLGLSVGLLHSGGHYAISHKQYINKAGYVCGCILSLLFD